jgi:hypothetical protein
MVGELVRYDSDLEWRGLLIGRGSPFEIITLTGWDGAPPPRRVTINRPGRHGTLPGELRAGERIVEADIQIGHRPLSLDAFRAARTMLRAALAWDENPVEEPLVVMLDGIATQVSARVVNFDIPTERQYDQGYQTASIQWAASDPRRYSTTLQQSSAGLPSASSSGLAFPLAFPLDFGPGQAGGAIILTNGGNTPAWPIFEVAGPITGPVITDTASGRAIRFAAGFEIVAGQTLRIDTDLGNVAIGPANRRHELVDAAWFPIPAGASRQIGWTATAGTGQLTGYLRDAYMT